jgi:hypothetical protein
MTRKKKHSVEEKCMMSSFIICTPHPVITQVIKSRRMKRTRHAACIGKKRNSYKVLLGKSEGKTPSGRARFS